MVYLQIKIIIMATDINSSSLTIAAASKDPGISTARDWYACSWRLVCLQLNLTLCTVGQKNKK